VSVRRLGPWIALAVVAVGLVVWAAWPEGGGGPAARTRELARELRCPDCEGLSVADSSTSTARAIRAEIRTMVDRGRSADEIRRVYVDRYGESILLEPDDSGLGLLVWLLPIVGLVAGGVGLVLALRRWTTTPRRAPTAGDEALVERARRSRAGEPR
jgi:cytochrome c-type biogenesis protein CcmH